MPNSIFSSIILRGERRGGQVSFDREIVLIDSIKEFEESGAIFKRRTVLGWITRPIDVGRHFNTGSWQLCQFMK